MCPPCKVVIDEENNQATCMADRLAGLIMGQMDLPASMAPHDDDHLFQLAEVEVEHILGVRQQILAHLKRKGVPPRWLALVEKIYGPAPAEGAPS